MPRDEFSVGPESAGLAEQIVAALRSEFQPLFQPIDAFRRDKRENEINVWPLHAVSDRVEVADLERDVRDFGGLLKVASARLLPAYKLGSRLVPMLPESKYLFDGSLEPDRGWNDFWRARGVSGPPPSPGVSATPRSPVPLISGHEAYHLFFEGLTSYLSTRIAGTAWLREGNDDSPPDGGGSYGGDPPPAGGGGGVFAMSGAGSGQWWTIYTQGAGLALCYGGTHAIRQPPNSIPGVTTPVRAFLPLGTIFIGADTGAPTPDWDYRVVTVPSHQPVFYTTRF